MADRRQDTPGTGDGDARDTRARPEGTGREARPKAPNDRDARLKAALRANIARRKARGRALDAQDGAQDDTRNGDADPTHEQPEGH